jgi:adenylate kinase
MRCSLTGTPGTGKTSAAAVLVERGHEVIEVGDFAREHLECAVDPDRGSLEVDIDALDRELGKSLPPGDVLLVGHLSHLVTTDLIIVLRCRPSVLEERLKVRGWPEAKVRENVEAEALDVILVESVESGREVREIDTTALPPSAVADAVEEILAGEKQKYAVGNVDWSSEVLGWF